VRISFIICSSCIKITTSFHTVQLKNDNFAICLNTNVLNILNGLIIYHSSMLHGSETWPIRKENEVPLQRAEMRMVRWMYGVKLQDRVQCKGLRERLGLYDIISVLQQNRLQWYGYVLWKEDNDWVKKCMEHEVEGARPRGRLKKTWRKIVEKDCQACKLNREDAMDDNRWRKQIRDNWSPW